LVRFLLLLGKGLSERRDIGFPIFPCPLRLAAQLQEMPVSRKTLRIFICAAAAAALGMFGTVAQATFYGGDFDPPDPTGHFTGHFIVNDVNDGCLHPDGGCQIDLISLVITSSNHFGIGDFSNGQTDIASSASFDGGLHFSSVSIPLTSPPPPPTSFVSAGLGSLAPAVNAFVMFTPDLGDDFFEHHGFIANLFNDAVFDNATVVDNAIYVAAPIPEPGSLGLLVGGIGAAWLTRRRKTRA
jgi:hypothetical protein